MARINIRMLLFALASYLMVLPVNAEEAKVVHFKSGELTLGGELYLPKGKGPFPTVLYNHGSAPGMLNSYASAAIAPKFLDKGWAFFMPYRRGQGLSADQGPYIMDLINEKRKTSFSSAVDVLIKAQAGPHLDDQMAALKWLQGQPFVDSARIATAGNSFGGIQVLLGMAKAKYCAGIDAAGAAESWEGAESLQSLLKKSAANANGPVFFFQAENDYDLSPSKTLYAAMLGSGKVASIKIYPKFGASAKDGHAFAYRGVDLWFQDAFTFLDKQCSGEMLNKAKHGDR